MPAAATLSAPVVTATALSATTGKLSWTASPGATGYQIEYLSRGQAVSLGSVSSGTTSVTITGMAPGTTYEFSVVAYNRTSQTASQWTTLTTLSSAASKAAFAEAGDSSPSLPVGVTFNLAAAANSGLASSGIISTVASDWLARGTAGTANATAPTSSSLGGSGNQTANGISNQTTGYRFGQATGAGSATAVDNAINSETDFGDASSLGADTTLGITLARQNDGRWWNSSTPVLAAGEASSADSETSLISRGLIGNLDTLFGSDINWADMPARTAGGESSALAATESTGAVAGGGDSEQPSATMLAVGLAISALWSESDRVKQSAEPRQPPLRRRRSSP